MELDPKFGEGDVKSSPSSNVSINTQFAVWFILASAIYCHIFSPLGQFINLLLCRLLASLTNALLYNKILCSPLGAVRLLSSQKKVVRPQFLANFNPDTHVFFTSLTCASPDRVMLAPL